MTQFTVQSGALRTLADNLESQVGSSLQQAAQSIETADIDGGKFSGDGIAMGLAYPGTRDFVSNDLASKLQFLQQACDELRRVAALYDAAESSNTLDAPTC